MKKRKKKKRFKNKQRIQQKVSSSSICNIAKFWHSSLNKQETLLFCKIISGLVIGVPFYKGVWVFKLGYLHSFLAYPYLDPRIKT
jgi:hypothetical protein